MQSMRNLLRGNLARSLSPLPALDRLTAAWPVACGPALAAHGEILSYDGATVVIRVANPAWLDTFGQMRAILQSDLARISGVHVTAIHFESKSRSESKPQNAAPPQRKP